ncbi:MAG: hypothetical protein HC857_16165 [Synechococcales cyanobacterium RU_4_20]|nr:hypothetical protein [Synechococcales cyanobacterium RU_4_20]
MAAQQYEKAVKRLEHYLQLKKQFDPAKPQTHVALARAYQAIVSAGRRFSCASI